MGEMSTPNTHFSPRPLMPGDDKFVPLARELGEGFAKDAEKHDRENSFVHENFKVMREAGYLRLPVPERLGGSGSTLRQTLYAQAELAKYCSSTGLSANMHLYWVHIVNWNYQRTGEPKFEAVLKKISEGAVFMTSGGADWIYPTGTATRVEGGYKINARKTFCSQAPVANVLTTFAAFDDPKEGKIVLGFPVMMNSPGVEIIETWDAMGMRGTGSHDVQLTDVFIPDAAITARRPWGKQDPVLRGAAVHFAPTTASVYYGIATAARDDAVKAILPRKTPTGRPLIEEPTIQRKIGEMDSQLMSAWWALIGAVTELGDNYGPEEAFVGRLNVAKAHVIHTAISVVDMALEVVGGPSYFRKLRLERLYRDVRAGKYHPLTPENTLTVAGRMALGLSTDDI